MNADSNNPVLPFVVWIAAVDLLCLEAWQVDAYTIGPQPWELWHENGWLDARARRHGAIHAQCPARH